MKKLWNVAGDIMPDVGFFSRLRKRWQCWQVRLFVRCFRPDICIKHGRTKFRDIEYVGEFSYRKVWVCADCAREAEDSRFQEKQRELARLAKAEFQHRANTEEILEALKHCKECK